MEYLIMFVTHIFKTAEYFIVEGLPSIPMDKLPEAAEAFLWQSLKLLGIYLSVL